MSSSFIIESVPLLMSSCDLFIFLYFQAADMILKLFPTAQRVDVNAGESNLSSSIDCNNSSRLA
jgi:hypothetical protein